MFGEDDRHADQFSYPPDLEPTEVGRRPIEGGTSEPRPVMKSPVGSWGAIAGCLRPRTLDRWGRSVNRRHSSPSTLGMPSSSPPRHTPVTSLRTSASTTAINLRAAMSLVAPTKRADLAHLLGVRLRGRDAAITHRTAAEEPYRPRGEARSMSVEEGGGALEPVSGVDGAAHDRGTEGRRIGRLVDGGHGAVVPLLARTCCDALRDLGGRAELAAVCPEPHRDLRRLDAAIPCSQLDVDPASTIRTAGSEFGDVTEREAAPSIRPGRDQAGDRRANGQEWVAKRVAMSATDAADEPAEERLVDRQPVDDGLEVQRRVGPEEPRSR